MDSNIPNSGHQRASHQSLGRSKLDSASCFDQEQYVHQNRYNPQDQWADHPQTIQAQVTSQQLREKLLLSRITEHHGRVKETFKAIAHGVKAGKLVQEDFNDLVLLLNISRNIYRPTNFPGDSFDELLQKARNDLDLLRTFCVSDMISHYYQLYKQVLETGYLNDQIHLPFDNNEKATSQQLQEFASKIVGGLIREQHREDFYGEDPQADPKAFKKYFSKKAEKNLLNNISQNAQGKTEPYSKSYKGMPDFK